MESRFGGGLDDVIIIPFVLVTLAVSKILRFILLMLMRLLDYAFPLAMQIVWFPLFAARVLGNVTVSVVSGGLRFLPVSGVKRRQWRISIRRKWSWLRRKISYRAFEQAVHAAFESGMAWVSRKCRHLTPNTALVVILGAAFGFRSLSGVRRRCMQCCLPRSRPGQPGCNFCIRWQLSSPRASFWCSRCTRQLAQAKKNSFVQFLFKSFETIKRLYVIKKLGFRYWQAEITGIAVVEKLERTAGVASLVTWLRKAHVAEHFGVETPTRKLSSFFFRWSIKFSAEYYEAKEREASGAASATCSKLRTVR